MPKEPVNGSIRHLEDGEPLTMRIANDGSVVVVCKACRKVWTGKLDPQPWPETVDRNAFAAMDDADFSRHVFEAMHTS